MNCRSLQASMDARIVAIFVFLFLSTGHSLKNDYVDDDVLDMLQETDNLKEAPEMVRSNAFPKFRSRFVFRQSSIQAAAAAAAAAAASASAASSSSSSAR